MNVKSLTVLITALALPFAVQSADTGFLEGETLEVIVKVRTADGKLKWYRVQPDGTRREMEMKPGDRFEFLYEESVDLDAITVERENK